MCGRLARDARGHRMLTTAQVAERLGLDPSRVRVLAAQGRIVAEKVGRDWVFREEAVVAFEAFERKPGRPRR